MIRNIYFYGILIFGFVSFGFASDMNGKWKGIMQGPEGAMEMVFSFSVSGDTLTGIVQGPMGNIPIANGKVKGDEFSFDVNASEMTISHHCKVLGDSISMKIRGIEGDMEVILKRLAKTKD